MPRPPKRPAAPRADAEEPQNRHIVSATWNGPLPPPALLEEFERVVPGGAERIFAQFENEAKHRRGLEEQNARFVIRDRHFGQALAGIYALGAFGLTAFAIDRGADWVASILGGGTIVSGVIAFLRVRSKKKTEGGANSAGGPGAA